MSRLRKGSMLAALAVASALCLVAADHAEARKGGSFGSRGTRTYQAPAATPTAPGAVAPVQRSTTPQATPQGSPSAAQRPPAAAARPSMFGSGLGGALMRGLLIGGLVGLLFGGGLGGLAGMMGLLLQVGLIALAVFLVLRLMRGAQPAAAAAGTGGRSAGAVPGVPLRTAAPAGGSSGTPPRRAGPPDEIGIGPADLDSFEQLLKTIQDAFSREDQGALRDHTTAEMFGFLADEMRDNAEAGVRNEVADVKLLQGDVAEAWQEGNRDYATVAMRFASRDVMIDRATGRAVSGDVAGPGESTEVWTFVRERSPTGDGAWRLSAIQGA